MAIDQLKEQVDFLPFSDSFYDNKPIGMFSNT